MTSASEVWSTGRASRRAARPSRLPALVILIRWLARVLPSWPTARRVVMQLAAFGFLDYAAWQWKGVILGCVAIGVSLFVVEALSGGVSEHEH